MVWLIIDACSYVAKKIRSATGGGKEKEEKKGSGYKCALSKDNSGKYDAADVQKVQPSFTDTAEGPVCRRGGGGWS